MASISYEAFAINVNSKFFNPMNVPQYPLKTILRNAHVNQIILAL